MRVIAAERLIAAGRDEDDAREEFLGLLRSEDLRRFRR
jgi:hypothetical protein